MGRRPEPDLRHTLPASRTEIQTVTDQPDITCPSCGYDASGLSGPTCPECGYEITDDDVALRERREIFLQLTLLRTVITLVVFAAGSILAYALPIVVLVPAVIMGVAATRHLPRLHRRLAIRIWIMSLWWLNAWWGIVLAAMVLGYEPRFGFVSFWSSDRHWAVVMVLTTAMLIAAPFGFTWSLRRLGKAGGLPDVLTTIDPALRRAAIVLCIGFGAVAAVPYWLSFIYDIATSPRPIF